MEWKLIDSAPKDRPILLYIPEGIQHNVDGHPFQPTSWTKSSYVVGRWSHESALLGLSDGWYSDIGWPISEYGDCGFEREKLYPTHWMPLPDYPSV